MTTHSVLGGEAQTYDSIAMRKAMLFSAPIGFATRFTNVCLITFAFVVTAQLTWMILEDQTPNTGQAARASLKQWRQILWFDVKFCVFMFAATSVEVFAIAQPIMGLCERLHISNQYLLQGCALMAVIGVAWVISPIALRLLRPQGDTKISPMQK